MELFNKLFGKKDNISSSLRFVNGGQTIFTPADGRVYENYVIRSAIHAFATHASKLNVKTSGEARLDLENRLNFKPNPFMDLSQFLYRCATILSVNNTLFILPVEDFAGRIVGYYPATPEICEIVEHKDELYLRYSLDDGSFRAVEYERVGIVYNFAYDSAFFGNNNDVLKPIVGVISTQNQGLIQGIKNGATLRFIAKIEQNLKETDIIKKRDEFNRINLDIKNNGGIGVYDNSFLDVKELKNETFTLNAAQSKLIEESVYKYFGVSEKIIKNDYSNKELEAFIKGKVEPFAKQLSAAMTNMTFSYRELAFGNKIIFYSDVFEYTSVEEKFELANKGVDRGVLTINEARALYGYDSVECGDVFIRRLEYSGTTDIDNDNDEEAQNSEHE